MVKEKRSGMQSRSNIGVRNPYPLAEAILLKRGAIQEPINWTKLPAETAKAYLYRAFHVSYEQLFDPTSKSPLYRGMPVEEAKKILPPRPGKEFLFSRKTGGGPCVCTPYDWIAQEETWKYPPAPPPATSSSCGSGPFGPDIMQGCVGDCYFIASLAAVAWTNAGRLTGKKVTTNPPLHNYKFMDPASGAVNWKNLERYLPVDQFGNLIYAKPTNNRCVWPSLYEKAYAVIQRQQDPKKPDICVLDFGNAATTLSEIARLPVGAMFVGETDWFDSIAGRCGNTSTMENMSMGKATTPMVAWTYVDYLHTPGHDEFTDDLIVANHSYTILGTGIVDGQQCLVLRNPYGISFADPVKEGIAEWDCVAWTNLTSLSTSIPNAPAVHPADGNFAMELNAFTRYFEGFCFTI